jgi:hypothetical protein
MIGKQFQSLKTQEVVKIDQMFENIAILDNGDRVSVQRLLDKNYFEEFIDPKAFLSQSAVDIIASKIKSIPDEVLNKLPDERESEVRISGVDGFGNVSSESAVILSDPEEEKRLLLQKYANIPSRPMSPPTPNRSLQDLLDDEPFEAPRIKTPRQIPVQENVPEPPKESPQMLMFKGVKRTHPIIFNVKLDTHIPRLDFIDMMEDSYEYSIIDWLSEEITGQIFQDRERIKSEIKDQINNALRSKSNVELSAVSFTTPAKKTRRSSTPTKRKIDEK